MNELDTLLKYVRTGTAEGDRPFLERVFLVPDQLEQLLSVEPGGMRLLVGSKGIGKSAIVEWLELIAQKRQLPCLLLRPDDLDTKALPTAASDIGTLKRHFYEALASAIAREIGSKLRGMLTGDAAKLYHVAQKAGLHDRDLIQKVLAVVSAISVPVAKIDGLALARELSTVDPSLGVIRTNQNHLLATGSVFFLLIDDTDQVASPSAPAQLNRIWALLLAVRRLAGETPSVRAIVTLRAEIWNRLISESEGQRDQADHLRSIVVSLRGDDRLIGGIVSRRLSQAAQEVNVERADLYSVFFADRGVSTTHLEQIGWQRFILESSRARPRDAIQLIKNMIDQAKARSSQRIGSAEADEAMKVYSKERVDDLYNEFSPDCPAIRQIVASFASVSPLTLDFEKLRAHLRSIPSRFSVTLRGRTLKPEDDGDATRILSLLHECGFIFALVSDDDDTLLRIEFRDHPSFVDSTNWNQMQSARWVIHYAFHAFLKNNRFNAPPKIRRRKLY